MVSVSVGTSPVYSRLGDGGTVTVPAGEVWVVSFHGTGAADFNNADNFFVRINGVNVFWGGDIQWERVVLDAGDTVTYDSTNGRGGMTIHGYRVQDIVSNTVVSEQRSADATVTVPAGETWDVSAYVTGQDDQFNGNNYFIRINGQNITRGGWDYEPKVVLNAGDTFAMDGQSDRGGFALQGFVVE